MISLLRNHLLRSFAKKERLLLMYVLLFISICLALFLSNQNQGKNNVAVIGEYNSTKNNNYIKISKLNKPPKTSELVNGTYDAIIDFSKNEPEVITIKNEKIKTLINSQFFENEAISLKKPETNNLSQKIIGFMLMFLLMSAVTNAFLYSEDREKNLVPRLLSSGLSNNKLIISYLFFTFSLIYFPTMLMLYFINIIMGISLGLSIINYAILMAIICLFAVCFALCNASFFDDADQASMIGSMFLVITSLVSGSFFELTTENKLWQMITGLLPQKQFLSLVANISNGQAYSNNLLIIIYLLVLSIILFIITIKRKKIN